MKKAYFHVSLGITLLFFITAAVFSQSQTNIIFSENFDSYQDDKAIQSVYTVWEDGALLSIHSTQHSDHLDNYAMQVDVISPNQDNQSTYGSIYHVLGSGDRNWAEANTLRFWIDNSHSAPLLLSFNFKEAFNEYWAIAQQGVYYLQSEEGRLKLQEIEYGNIPVQSDYQGWIVVPFTSFSVPDWDTARGNGVMNLKHIESFALSISIGQDYPRSFLLDDIQILAADEPGILLIEGPSTIQVPQTGTHHEQYAAFLISPDDESKQTIEAAWVLQDDHSDNVQISQNGELIIPSTAQSTQRILTASYEINGIHISRDFNVDLTKDTAVNSTEPTEKASTQSPTLQPTLTAYDQISEDFEVWAVENRPLFVLLSIAAVLLIVFLLTWLQQRLK